MWSRDGAGPEKLGFDVGPRLGGRSLRSSGKLAWYGGCVVYLWCLHSTPIKHLPNPTPPPHPIPISFTPDIKHDKPLYPFGSPMSWTHSFQKTKLGTQAVEAQG